jgi:capping protein alpha
MWLLVIDSPLLSYLIVIPNSSIILDCLSPHVDTETSIDVQTLTEGEDIIPQLAPAFERYNESQLTTVKLPGSSQEVG